jgi:LMBR1 domain-containing protein 1
MWQIVLWTVASFIILIIPFTTFFYEAYDPDQYSFVQQIGPALMYTFVVLFLFVGLLLTLWFTIGYAEIPYFAYATLPQKFDPFDARLVYSNVKTVQRLQIGVSIFVYTVGLIVGIGWFFFCIFGGVGLVALPVETMSDFMGRPKPMSLSAFNQEKERIAGRATRLMEVAKQLEKKGVNKRSTRRKINTLRGEVMQLEKELERAVAGYNDRGTGPIKAVLMVMLACFGGIMSLLWIMHVFMYNATRANPFLNTFLVDLDKAFSLLGTAAYAMLAFYLLWATVKGCFKVGLRIVFFTIHPMKLGDTLMNAMLFNCGLVLLCSVVVTQFCVMSFDIYASNTSIDGLLNLFVRRLKYIGDAMFYFQFVFVGIALLSIFWIILCPRQQLKKEDGGDSDDD